MQLCDCSAEEAGGAQIQQYDLTRNGPEIPLVVT